MPITDAEWDAGETGGENGDPTSPVGDYGTEKDLIVAFLSENADHAYTRPEVVRGVDFGENDRPETIREVLTELQDGLVAAAGDLAATGIVVDDVDAALDELVAEGTVAEKTVDTGDGEVTYYRLNTDDARDGDEA